MQLNQEHAAGYFYVRSCRSDAITVIDRVLCRSFIIAPDRIVEDWPVRSIVDLDEAAVATLLTLSPELVILGTGIRQVFPAASLQALLMTRQIGVEFMDNAAACRTYNLLAAEGRRVVAGLMLAT
ncbi:MAG: Mth938-like domain-containing protein [Dokdonella sp.]